MLALGELLSAIMTMLIPAIFFFLLLLALTHVSMWNKSRNKTPLEFVRANMKNDARDPKDFAIDAEAKTKAALRSLRISLLVCAFVSVTLGIQLGIMLSRPSPNGPPQWILALIIVALPYAILFLGDIYYWMRRGLQTYTDFLSSTGSERDSDAIPVKVKAADLAAKLGQQRSNWVYAGLGMMVLFIGMATPFVKHRGSDLSLGLVLALAAVVFVSFVVLFSIVLPLRGEHSVTRRLCSEGPSTDPSSSIMQAIFDEAASHLHLEGIACSVHSCNEANAGIRYSKKRPEVVLTTGMLESGFTSEETVAVIAHLAAKTRDQTSRQARLTPVFLQLYVLMPMVLLFIIAIIRRTYFNVFYAFFVSIASFILLYLIFFSMQRISIRIHDLNAAMMLEDPRPLIGALVKAHAYYNQVGNTRHSRLDFYSERLLFAAPFASLDPNVTDENLNRAHKILEAFGEQDQKYPSSEGAPMS